MDQGRPQLTEELEKLKFNGVVSNVEGGIGEMIGDVMMIEDDQLMIVDGRKCCEKQKGCKVGTEVSL